MATPAAFGAASWANAGATARAVIARRSGVFIANYCITGGTCALRVRWRNGMRPDRGAYLLEIHLARPAERCRMRTDARGDDHEYNRHAAGCLLDVHVRRGAMDQLSHPRDSANT